MDNKGKPAGKQEMGGGCQRSGLLYSGGQVYSRPEVSQEQLQTLVTRDSDT